jgi:hypothetical protein
MAGEQIPVVNDNTGDETTMPWEALESWAEKGWRPIEEDWRERYGVLRPEDLAAMPDTPPAPPG